MKKTGAVLGPILKNLGLESGVRLALIKHDWHEIFDEQIASNLFPVSFSDNELLLHVTSPIWMQQFSFHKNEIIKKLRAYEVLNVRFRLGRIPQKKHAISPKQKAPELSRENVFFINELLSDIGDENLKDTIKKAVEKSLTSKKSLQAS